MVAVRREFQRNQAAIIAACLTLSRASYKSLMTETGLSRGTINRHLQVLKRSGVMASIWAQKTGAGRKAHLAMSGDARAEKPHGKVPDRESGLAPSPQLIP